MSKKFNTHGAAAFFSGNNANVQEVQDVQQVQDVQEVEPKTAEPLIHHGQEVQDVQEVWSRKTQGKKGAELPRAHISLSPAAYNYLRQASARNGLNMSQYIENLLFADKEKSSRVD